MMKNQKRNVGLAVLSVLTLGCAVTAGSLADNKATQVKAADAQTFAMVDGASVRLDAENYGLRFTSEIGSGSTYTQSANVSYHMMIIPQTWITKYELSGDYMTTLQAKLKAEAETNGTQQKTIATIQCTPKYSATAVEDYKADTWYISGALTTIKYGNLNGDFFGLAYALDTKGTAETTDDTYTYASFNAGENVRSIVQVASAAYSSGKYTAGTTEMNIITKLVNQGLHSANGDPENTKDTVYDFNPTMESEKYIVKGNTYQLTVSGIPAKANLKTVWTSTNPSVATVDENGLVTAGNTAGQTAISCEVFGKKVSCLVTVGDRKSETQELGNYVLNSMTVSQKDFVQEGIVGEVASVTIGSTALESTEYSVVDGTLTIPYATIKDYYGVNKTITVSTGDTDYIYKANIVTLSITDKSQFIPDSDGLNTLQKVGGLTVANVNLSFATYTGYFVLENDIDFDGAEVGVKSVHKGLNNVVPNAGLIGAFEGNGHTLSDFTINSGSLFGGIANGATLQNLKVIKGSLGSSAVGLFGYYMFGTYSNLFVDMQTARNGALACAAQYDTTMTNCTFVIYGTDAVTGNLLAGTGGLGIRKLNATNSTVITNKNENTMWNFIASPTITNDITVKGFQSLNVNAGVDVSITFANAAEVWLDGENITDDANVELTDSEVTIDSDMIALSASKRVIVKNASNTEVFQVSVSVAEVNETKEFSLYSTEKNNETNEVTWSAKAFEYAIEGTPVTATIDGADASQFLSAGKFVVPVENVPDYYGEKTVYIETTTHKYTLKVTFATLYITDAYQLVDYKNHISVIQYIGGLTSEKFATDSRYYGYFVLVNDINFNGAEIAMNQNGKPSVHTPGLTGTFDGNGKTLSNFKITKGYSFFGGVAGSSNVKDLCFENVTISESASIMGTGGGTWTNVRFNVTSLSGSVLGNSSANPTTLIDCVFIVKAEESKTNNVIFNGVTYPKCTTLTNITVITNVTATPFATVNGSNIGTTNAHTAKGFTNVNVYEATFADSDTVTYTENAEVYLDGVKLTKDTDYTVAGGVVTLVNVTAGTHTVSVVSATTQNDTTKVYEGTATVYTVTVA